MQNFNLFFYYKNRSKIRNSYFLESFSAKLKDFILLHYREYNYIWIDQLIRIAKFLVFSLIYLIIILSVNFNHDSLHTIGYSIFAFIGFFIALVCLSYNKESLKDVEHDHYFRMLSTNRNELLKEIILRRINYGFLNWMIPMIFPLFLFAAILTNFYLIVQYIVLFSLYYLFLFIIVFSTQKLLFKYLKKTVIISDILIYVFSILIVIFPILLQILILVTAELFADYTGNLFIYTSLSVLIIFLLWSLKKYIYKETFNYSITNTLLVASKKNYKGNKIKEPPFFVGMFYSKDDFSNLILTKDLLSFYRKDKRETHSLIFVSLMSLVYSGFLISALQSGDPIKTVIPIDNILLSIIMIFFIITHYRYKEINWYSSEGVNLELFRRLKHQVMSLYKSKIKLNAIILLPMILFYALSPIFFIMTYNDTAIIYAFTRMIFIITYAIVILEYPLINDAKKTILTKYKDLLFMSAGDLIMFVFFIQGMGLSILLTFMTESSYLSDYSYIYWVFIGLIFMVMISIKIRFLYIRRSFKQVEV
ncbi:hypothetical protein KHQ88_05210 [Mycoplasmatota bacterium]|nr:hypothetical protein KHQ88_05210 [Mycoplasmatota bacterium]